jgi:flagellar hook protein FlgE
MMDVVGHNISNVNTPGFKSSRITFEEALAQTLGPAAPAGSGRGGVNPLQLGLGARVSSIEGVFTQGAALITGRATDIAIQGDGFFTLDLAGQRLYTRAGAFSFDEEGTMVAPNGATVQGWQADASGVIDNQLPVGQITLPLSQVIEAVDTDLVSIGGNLSAALGVGETYQTTTVIYDSIGNTHNLLVRFENTAAGAFDVDVEIDGAAVTTSPTGITFDTAGQLSSTSTIAVTGPTPGGADPISFDIELGGLGGMVQFGGASTAEVTDRDGMAEGVLRGFIIDEKGRITAQFSNGETDILAQIATATFENPDGLVRTGDTAFIESLASGGPDLGAPGEAVRGLLSAGALESSNVDLGQEFTNLIIAQRGFQANGRVITTSDEMLSELVNLKR